METGRQSLLLTDVLQQWDQEASEHYCTYHKGDHAYGFVDEADQGNAGRHRKNTNYDYGDVFDAIDGHGSATTTG